MAPLWHAIVVLRAITAAFAIASILLHHDGFARPGWGWAVLAGISVWTVLSGLAYGAYCDDRTRRTQVIVLDVLVTLAFLGSSALVLSPEQLTGLARTPLLTTVWASGPVLAAAVHAGWVAGALVGLAVSVLTIWLRAAFTIDLARDAILLIGTGCVLGLAAGAARQATEQLRSSTRDEAATAERARLARSVHDSVLQVLARVRARSGQLDGGQLGGEAGELVRLAGEQEIALRHLFSSAREGGQPGSPERTGEHDLAAALQLLASPRVEVSVPAAAVPLPAADVAELVALAREALTNTTRHGGPAAKAWILLEDLGEDVALTIRDDGPGVEDGQLAAAERAGRLGVSCSIRGRVAQLGGTLRLDTGPGRGTEWEVRLARVRPSLLR